MARRRADHIMDAARAHTNLTTFAAVEAILEGGCIYGPNASARRIIAMCNKERQRQLRIYDAAIAKAERGAPCSQR